MRRRLTARLGVTHKLWLSVVAMVIAVLLPVGFAVDRAVTAFYHQQNAADLLRLGQRFANFLARAPAEGASEAVRAIAEITATPLLVLNREGVTVAGSGELASEVGKRPQNPRILSALRGEESVFLALDDNLPGSLVVTAVPIRQGPEVVGAVVLFRPVDRVRQAVARVRALLALAVVGLFLLLAAFGWFLSRRLVRPLLAMKDAADQMAQGHYSSRVEAPGDDELGRLAEAINRLSSRLHQLEAGRRSFFANISHELRTPLSYLQGYSDALADGLASSPEEAREYGRIIAEESRRLGRLVDDLFLLAQTDEARLSLHLTEVDVSRAVGRVLERVRSKADAKEIKVEAHVPEGTYAVADPDRLEQILLNLLDNAVRHAPPGGLVRLTAVRAQDRDPVGERWEGDGGFQQEASRAVEAGTTFKAAGQWSPVPLAPARGPASSVEQAPGARELRKLPGAREPLEPSTTPGSLEPPAAPASDLEAPGPSRRLGLMEPSCLAIVVDDSGPGLDGDPASVWDRFYRGERSRNRDFGGAGLGLAIVRSLVEAHGGTVWAEAHGPLGGARLGFSLRCAERSGGE